MRLIEKAILGLTALGTVGTIGAAITEGIASENRGKINEQINELKATSGYIAADYEYKSSQIGKLMQDYSLGLIEDGDLVEKIKAENLTELDFDKYAKNYFTEQEYNKYLKIKEANIKNTGISSLACNGIVASITAIGVSMGAFIVVSKDAKNKQKQKDIEDSTD